MEAYFGANFICYDCPYTIQGEHFEGEFKMLRLKGYDIILGVDWLKQYISVELDCVKMLMRITTPKGEHVIFHDETLPY